MIKMHFPEKFSLLKSVLGGEQCCVRECLGVCVRAGVVCVCVVYVRVCHASAWCRKGRVGSWMRIEFPDAVAAVTQQVQDH